MAQPPATISSRSAGPDSVLRRNSMEPEFCQEPWITAAGGCFCGTLRASRFASGAERFQAFRRLSEAFFAERHANGKDYLPRFYGRNAIMLHMMLGLCCRSDVVSSYY